MLQKSITAHIEQLWLPPVRPIAESSWGRTVLPPQLDAERLTAAALLTHSAVFSVRAHSSEHPALSCALSAASLLCPPHRSVSAMCGQCLSLLVCGTRSNCCVHSYNCCAAVMTYALQRLSCGPSRKTPCDSHLNSSS